MIRRNKWLLGFSIVYWLIIIMGAILNIFALRKVPLETYGLRAYSFSPNVSPVYYTPGLYNIGVGYYFITFPSSKQYVLDNKVIVTNKNLEKLQVTYSFCYRLNPNKIFDLYQTIGHDYEQYLIAAVNNMVSSVYTTLQQSQSRVTAQSIIIANINAANDKISSVLSSSATVEGLWINELTFNEATEKQYQNSLYLSDSYEQSYETSQIEYQKTRLQALAVQQEMALLKQELRFNLQSLYNSRFSEVVATDVSLEQTRETRLSYNYLMKRIWTVTLWLCSTITPPN